jgi:hypothetical protein
LTPGERHLSRLISMTLFAIVAPLRPRNVETRFA